MARAAFQLAATSERIRTDVVEVQEFPELARKYMVRGVPMTVINDDEVLMGAVPAMHLVEAIERCGGAPVEPTDEKSESPDSTE